MNEIFKRPETFIDPVQQGLPDNSAFIHGIDLPPQRPSQLLDHNLNEQHNDSDLHAFLVSQLFDAPTETDAAQPNLTEPAAASGLTWHRNPVPPAKYQNDALSLFGNDEAIKHEDIVSTPSSLNEQSIPAVRPSQQSASDPGPAAHSPKPARRKERRKQDSQGKAKKRSARSQEESSDTIYDQLERTVAELNALKLKHQQLESKNLLLEKCLRLEHTQKLRQASQEEMATEGRYIAQETNASEQGPSVTLTVRCSPHSITVYEVSKMGVPEFAALWTDYIQSIGACLVQSGHSTAGPSVELLQRLTVESSQLLGCIKLLNHKVHKAMLQGQMDSKLASAHSIDRFYKTYVGLLDLSKEQFRDLEVLRRIYLMRRATLARERNMLLHQVTRSLGHSEDTVPLPDNSKVAGLAKRLQELAQEDYRVYHRVAAATRRGVFSTKQWATVIVHAYPYMPDVENALEAVAKATGQPSKQQILNDRSIGSMGAQWEGLEAYLDLLAKQTTHDHVPLSVQPVFRHMQQ